MMVLRSRLALLLGFALLALGCSITPAPPGPKTPSEPAPSPSRESTLILISLDGFRWDFLDHGVTPVLSRLAREGVHAERLIPSFPTKTFPNHYTIATGLRPAEHGLVANNIWDPATRKSFGLSNREAVRNGAWYGGEPIWVTAEKAGLKTAPLFWPGSEAEILGVRPTISIPYDGDMAPADRVDLILQWLDLPDGERPRFLTLYFSDVDDGAHQNGPEPSEPLAEALETVDRAVGRLLAGLDARGLEDAMDLLIVSDHGMSSTSRDRVILLDDYVDIAEVNVVDWNPVLALWPPEERVDEVYRSLKDAHPNLAVYRRDEIPAGLDFSGHPRIAPIVGIADDGWSISGSARLQRCPQCFDGGTHGYDPALESMGALLIARGPSFRSEIKLGPVDNVDLYNVMCAILGLTPAPNSGDPASVPRIVTARRGS